MDPYLLGSLSVIGSTIVAGLTWMATKLLLPWFNSKLAMEEELRAHVKSIAPVLQNLSILLARQTEEGIKQTEEQRKQTALQQEIILGQQTMTKTLENGLCNVGTDDFREIRTQCRKDAVVAEEKVRIAKEKAIVDIHEAKELAERKLAEKASEESARLSRGKRK